MTTFGIVVFDDAEELDLVGPWEVFGASAQWLGHSRGADAGAGAEADRVVLIAERTDPVRCAKGLRVVPDHSFDDHPDLDVVLVPGGMGTRTEGENRRMLDWLAHVDSTTSWTTSVCTGSFLLARSGVADGKRVATHWGFEDTLDEEPNVEVERSQRWVVDGKIVTSQGVSAGIDMALWLIGEMYGPEHARTVQHYIQYDPDPPYQETTISEL